jgi:hypothetical protein
MSTLTQAEEFFDGVPFGARAVQWVSSTLGALGSIDVVVTRSQVAFRRAAPGGRTRGVAYLWRPGQYLSHPQADMVLSVPLSAPAPSPRWKEIAHPTPTTWMHHLEVRALNDLDDQVAGWLREAYASDSQPQT